MTFLKNKYSIFIGLLLVLASCSTANHIQRDLKKEQRESSFFKGFVLYNPETKKEIINYKGAKYFTPASNTKLFTFYTAYKALGDSIDGLAYYRAKDSLIIKGTADPSFLYGFGRSKVFDFLKQEKDSIYLVDASIDEEVYGSGWAWDDYSYYYMPEKSLFPIYGNIVSYNFDGASVVSRPLFFKKEIHVLDSISKNRELLKNKFYFPKERLKAKAVPFISSLRLTKELLCDTLNINGKVIEDKKHYKYKLIKSVRSKELYVRMLQVSDNFIAEQLLLQVGNKVSNSYSVAEAIAYSLSYYLQDLPQKPRWVDGSGLSRYNLFSPNDMVFVLDKMYKEIPLQELLAYFPVENEEGSLAIQKKNFVYAKTGSLSNNYNLSGYLVTKKGTVLIFSYMNNHYKEATAVIKKQIKETLKEIYNSY